MPEDARFCHKCGKPQREEDLRAAAPEPEQTYQAPPPPPLPEPPRISLRDRTTVSTALMAAGVTLLLSVLLGPLGFLAPVGGGVFAVYIYRRRSGRPLNVLSGVRLGWLAGVVVFTLSTVFITIAAVGLSQPEIAQQVREQMAKTTGSSQEMTRVIDMLSSFSGVLLLLVGVFISSTLLMGLGGAMGALLSGRGPANHPHA